LSRVFLVIAIITFFSSSEGSGRDIKTIKALGRKAMGFTRRTVDKKQIRLEFDLNNACIGQRDKYGRILAYVYHGWGFSQC
jgi:endonuclease YncB( thermonuclease family)